MSLAALKDSPATYKNYTVTRVVDLPELQMRLLELTHGPTGALIMHLAASDDENFFCLSFRTWPKTSNGVAHILEHTVLCGSDKFPIRDPFFEMGRRSLNTFMNALTGADFTSYPAATQVPKDFYNLLDVYIDAVFHPKLTKESFLQEGHRLEFEKSEDSRSPLCYKGIVFNEMKGALNSGETRLGELLMEALFPDITYGVNSGGDPKEIPKLTHDELKAFHSTYYHPSRCLFFFYGNLPLEDHLDFLEEHAFKGVQKQPHLPAMPKQKRFTQKVVKKGSYPIAPHEEENEKSLIGIGLLTCSILDQEELLALSVVELVLMGTDAAPLKCALLRSGLCKQVDSSLDGEMSEVPFTFVFKGCSVENVSAIETLLEKTLQQIIQEGLPENLIEGSIHQLEMSRSEITGNSSPYGLSLFFRSALLRQHHGNPEDGLLIHTLFRRLREKVKNPQYLTSLIEKHLLKNTHRVTVILEPDPNLGAKELAEELEGLQLLKASLSDTAKNAIIAQSQHLAETQEMEEDADILPKVTLADVPHVGKEFPLKDESIGAVKLFTHACFTNEILYADLLFDLPDIAEKDLPLFRLFSLLLPQVGCGGRDYKAHLDYVLENTGGVGASLDLYQQADDPNKMRPMLILRGKCLHHKIDKLFPLFRDVLQTADFSDVARLKELLMQHYLGLENSLTQSALRYSVNLAASGLSIPSRIINAWYGLDYFWKIKEIAQEFDVNPQPLIDKMREFQQKAALRKEFHIVLSGQEKSFDKLKKENFFGLFDLKASAFDPWKGAYTLEKTPSQGRIIASPVAFTSLIFPAVPYLHPASPLLNIAAEIMDNCTLHKRIREQGGAYGSGSVHAGMSGQFYFYSYRDPHVASTLSAFKEAVEGLIQGDFDEQDLEEAKLGILQDLDSPCAPGSRAMTAYSRLRSGRTPKERQLYRERLLQATLKQVKAAAKEHLFSALKQGTCVTFAAKELLQEENALLEKPFPLYSI